MMALALLLAVLALPAAEAGAAAATVGNGLTTTDLNAVGMSPSTLASTLVGTGVSVSNVTFTGANAQAGTVHLVDPAVVSFNDAVILSSGNIADAVGPNKSDGITGDMAGPGDPDLDQLIANTQTVLPETFDAASLEFDFVPAADHVYFTYTFASDEYLEWVNLFNDVFAFFVNGQNCATVPSDEPVSIDTINSAVNTNLFRDNSYSSPPANPLNIEYDGLSVEMICSAAVHAGQTNHMKLAIADTSDQILDSTVMIKADSLSTVKPESCNDGQDNDDDLLVDMEDPNCQSTTTPPPTGSGGIGSGGSNPPFTGNEGTPITLDASALGWVPSPDTVTTSWTVTGINGTPGTCEISPPGRLPLNPDGSIAVVTALCPNEGEYTARVDGWDVEGGGSFDTDVDFFVHNAPPAVAIDAPALNDQVAAGATVDLSATVTDPGALDSVSCAIDWGDGTSEAGTLADGSCTGSHAYADPGTQLLSVTASDDAGGSAAAATILQVTSIGSISGEAVDGSTGLPIADLRVRALQGGVLVGQTYTAADGTYTIGGLTTGTYDLQFADTSVSPARYPLTLHPEPVSVGSSGLTTSLSPVPVLDAISGRAVELGTSAGAGAVRVRALQGGSVLAQTSTAADGTYMLPGLPAGQYTLQFADTTGVPTRYQLTLHPGTVAAGTVGVTTELAPAVAPATGQAIAGRAADGVSGDPVANVRVRALQGGSVKAQAYTAADGTYALAGLATGTYSIQFADVAVSPARYQLTVHPVLVAAGTSGLSTDLTPIAAVSEVSGRALDAGSGLGIAGLRVRALVDGVVKAQAFTAADGSYTLAGLPTGSFSIQFADTVVTPKRYPVTYHPGLVASGTTGITTSLTPLLP